MNNEQKSMLAMTEEEVMELYARVHLKQTTVGAVDFRNCTVKFQEKNKLPKNHWRRSLLLSKYPVKAVLKNWSFDSTTPENDFNYAFSRTVKYGNGGSTTRIIGYDLPNSLILTETGSVYKLSDE